MVRYKHRYFAAQIVPVDRPSHAPLSLKNGKLYHLILKMIKEIHGEFGIGAVIHGLKTIYCNPYTKVILIRSRHGPHRFVATVLPLIRHITGISVQVNILYVGATIVACYKYIKNYQLQQLEKYWNKIRSDEDRELFKKSIMDLSLLLNESKMTKGKQTEELPT